ncbi:MAG: MATE family efflux transporter [Deltaproteobacteria bacterium]|nr:MATE family efflux transporter [Deltaproteobacteria bacterium]
MIELKASLRLKRRWHGDGGYREVLAVSLPLVISTGMWSVQHFVDRMFLTWYSPAAIAAAMPAGMLSFTIACIFIGTASYAGTFVAQYYGANRFDRCGPSLWQGIYIALGGGALQMLLIPLAGPIFRFVGHAPEIRSCEEIYFVIMCYGAIPVIASSAMAGFFSGLGKTRPVMWVNIAATAVNLLLDWLLIFGRGGFPELGIAGAGIATVCSFIFTVVMYGVILARRRYAVPFNTLGGWRFDVSLFTRLCRFGFPSGVQFFLEIAGFTVFILFVGRLGTVALAASNIAFNINTLAFMPMIGIGIATSVLVGRRVGERDPRLAERTAYSAFHVTILYMVTIAAAYLFLPGLFIEPFAAGSDPAYFSEIRAHTIVLLRFVAIYSLFDTMNIVFASAVKGAGDTRFVMLIVAVLSLFVMILPSYAALAWFSLGIYELWVCATAYVITLGIAFYCRFRGGKWKTMSVIEERAFALPPAYPEAPTGSAGAE